MDVWWNIDERTNMSDLANELITIFIKEIFPFYHQILSDEGLLNYWKQKKRNGLKIRSELIAILLKKLNKIDEMNFLLSQMEKAEQDQLFCFCRFEKFKQKLLEEDFL